MSEVLYRSSVWVGGVLSRPALTDGRWLPGADGPWYGKRRRWYAALLVAAGNAVFRVAGHHSRMLRSRAWVAREEDVYRHAYRAAVVRQGRRLLLPALPGRPVAALLRASDLDHGRKLIVVRAAARALLGLHRLVVPEAGRIARGFTHADATVSNVLYDEPTGLARWVDFETVHAPSLDEATCRAEDLRALAYSAAACLGAHEYDVIPAALTTGYPERSVLTALCALLRGGTSITLPLHLAAVPPTLSALQSFTAGLLRHIEEWTSQDRR